MMIACRVLSIFSRIIWILTLILCGSSIIWFLLGTTANFQRSLDLVSTFILVYIWIPVLIFVAISINLLLKKWVPQNRKSYIILWVLIILAIRFSFILYSGVSTSGWLHVSKTSDPLKLTSDAKYEYQIELINLFQNNSREQLYLRKISTGEEMYIPVNLFEEEIHTIGIPNDEDWAWATLNHTSNPAHYELITTKRLSVEIKKFLIDVDKGIIINLDQ